jgi:riboflavin synthase
VFTGLVEEVGEVAAAEAEGDGMRFRILAERVLEGTAAGDSIAVDGVCLTVVELPGNGFEVQAIATTLQRTTLGELRVGDLVNLERALAFGQRLGGHLVQGHVDATGTVVAVRRQGEHVLVDIDVPEVVAEATVLHGSVAVQGVSLTVNALSRGRLQVALIPHTWQHTNLRTLTPGATVNLEADLIGRYVASHLKRMYNRGVSFGEPRPQGEDHGVR